MPGIIGYSDNYYDEIILTTQYPKDNDGREYSEYYCECKRCGAIVALDSIDLHLDFHKKVEQCLNSEK